MVLKGENNKTSIIILGKNDSIQTISFGSIEKENIDFFIYRYNYRVIGYMKKLNNDFIILGDNNLLMENIYNFYNFILPVDEEQYFENDILPRKIYKAKFSKELHKYVETSILPRNDIILTAFECKDEHLVEMDRASD
jgi:hypothetical protein